MHATRTASKHKDDAEDEHGNVFEYCVQLFRYSLTPRTNAQYMKTIELCDVTGSPNTLQAIWGIPPLCHSATVPFAAPKPPASEDFRRLPKTWFGLG